MDGVTVTLTGTNALAGYLQPGGRVDVYANITKVSTGSRARRRSRCRARSWRWRTSRCSTSRAPSRPTPATRPPPAVRSRPPRRSYWPSTRSNARSLEFLAAERDGLGGSDPAGHEPAAGGAVHRHRPDDGGAMISRRILVISRSPALSRAIQASLGSGVRSRLEHQRHRRRRRGAGARSLRRPRRGARVRQPCRHGAPRRPARRCRCPRRRPGPRPQAQGEPERHRPDRRGGADRVPDEQAPARQLAAAGLRHRRHLALGRGPERAGRGSGRGGRPTPVRRGVHGGLVQRRLRQDVLRHQPGVLPGGTDGPARAAWSIWTCSSARSPRRCTCGRGSPSRTCCPGNRSTTTTSTSTSRSTSRSTSSGSRCSPPRSARPTPT